MALPSYQEITRQLDIPRCRGILPNGQYCPLDHAVGEIDDVKVHWGDERRVTRAGIRRYLALEALRRTEIVYPMPTPIWIVHYRTLRKIPELAAEIKVQLPHELGDLDRSILRATILRQPINQWPETRREALMWLAGQRQRSGGVRHATSSSPNRTSPA